MTEPHGWTGGRLLTVNGVALWVEHRGNRGDPALLLIAGAGSSSDYWPDALCARLAEGGRFVIRYDHRDTGRSVAYPAGRPGYTGADLAADVVGVLDALDLDSAHLMGISMGGALAQRVAVDHPERVDSLVLLSTTAALDGGPAGGSLPPPTGELRAFLGEDGPDPTDRTAVVAHLVAYERHLSGPDHFDESAVRRTVEHAVDHTRDLAASLVNHSGIADGPPAPGTLRDIRARTLVVHGTMDPLFPSPHGEALAAAIAGAELLPLDGVGHQVPPPATWPIVVPAILRHTAGGWQARADRLAAQAIAAGDPTGWFDRLYAAGVAGEVDVPWDRRAPHPLLAEWATRADGAKRAVVVGCGLGADAEFVAGLGYETTAFDLSATAIRLARERNPGTAVRYVTADLFDLPTAWQRAFDLVVEIHTVQALPDPPRGAAIRQVASLVAPGGTLLVIGFRADSTADAAAGPPFPLERCDIDAFATDGLEPVGVTEAVHGGPRWVAEFRRPT
jgi:pimeloyl-ACP methyl ester carboxylesterase/SAM-dependent methyltransferase